MRFSSSFRSAALTALSLSILLGSLLLGSLLLGLPAVSAPGGAWQVLVLDQLSPRTGDAGPKWSTIWCDGAGAKRFETPVVNLGGAMAYLKVSAEKKREACPKGKYPFSYAVEELVSEPLSGGQGTVLLGQTNLSAARALMKDHIESCDGIKPLPKRPDTTESYERSRVTLLSVFGDLIGVEQVSESFSYGREKALAINDWGTYKFRDDELWKAGRKALPAGAAAEAASKFAKLAQGEKDPFSPADFSHYVLVPSGGGLAAEFGVPATSDAALGAARVIRVERPQGLANEMSVRQSAFVAAHPKLIGWAKATFYTVAPDQSAVVYALDGKLYWQPALGAAKLIGQVKNVRGWQWQQASKLSHGDKQFLGSH